MKIISPNKPVCAKHNNKEFWYKAFCRYVVSDYEAAYYMQNSPNTGWKCSSFNSYERRPGKCDDLNGKKIIVYRHTAFGDQLMISSVPRYIKSIYPNSTVHLYCSGDIVDMWEDNPFIGGSAIPLPIPFDVIREYDYHLFYEGMLENNGEHDQNNCYDDYFGWMGREDVPPQFKRPFIQILPKDYHFVKRAGLDLTGNYLVYHLSPANKNRCYPMDKGLEFIKLFLCTKSDWRVVVVGTPVAGMPEMPDDPRIVNLVGKTSSFRDLIPVIERASVFVGPDSSVMHLAACFPHVVSISLWGLFHPNDRVKYYPNTHPIFVKGVCKEAPCHNHDFSLPVDTCREAEGWKEGRNYCCVLDAISPEDIMNKIREVVR